MHGPWFRRAVRRGAPAAALACLLTSVTVLAAPSATAAETEVTYDKIGVKCWSSTGFVEAHAQYRTIRNESDGYGTWTYRHELSALWLRADDSTGGDLHVRQASRTTGTGRDGPWDYSHDGMVGPPKVVTADGQWRKHGLVVSPIGRWEYRGGGPHVGDGTGLQELTLRVWLGYSIADCRIPVTYGYEKRDGPPCADATVAYRATLPRDLYEKARRWFGDRNVDLEAPLAYVNLTKNYCWDGERITSASSVAVGDVTTEGRTVGLRASPASAPREQLLDEGTSHRSSTSIQFTWTAPVLDRDVVWTPTVAVLGYRDGGFDCAPSESGHNYTVSCFIGKDPFRP